MDGRMDGRTDRITTPQDRASYASMVLGVIILSVRERLIRDQKKSVLMEYPL